ncbi:amino acid/polyamine transporter I [Umbelopsis sp. AD052]|nr:amino acid/polyamine transporter I [Umbelopsis sp. AD052]
MTSKVILSSNYGSIHHETNSQPLPRTVFSTFATFGLAFTNIGILSNLSASFQTGILSGGPVTMISSWNVVAFFMLCIALSLAEICSAYPFNGIYYWAYELVKQGGGPKSGKAAPFVAFVTGWIYCLAMIIAAGSADLSVALAVASMIRMMSDGAVDLSMTTTLILAIAILISHALLNVWNMQLISLLNEVSVWWSCGGLVVICAILAAFTPQHNDVWWVLTDYENYTGFSSVSYVVMLSMVCAAYTLFGCESVAQVAEETEEADSAAPFAMVASIAVSWFVGLIFLFILLLYTQDIQSIEQTQYEMPIAQLFLDAVGSRWTMVLLVILVVSQYFTGCTTITLVSRLIFSLARDHAVPVSERLSHVNDKAIPDNAVWAATGFAIFFISPYPFSDFVFNAVLSATTVTANLTYAIVLLCRLIVPIKVRGRFSLGAFSTVITALGFIWTIFAVIAFILPTRWPITVDNFNYASLGVTGVILFTLLNWWFWAKDHYHGPTAHINLNHVYIPATSVA